MMSRLIALVLGFLIGFPAAAVDLTFDCLPAQLRGGGTPAGLVTTAEGQVYHWGCEVGPPDTVVWRSQAFVILKGVGPVNMAGLLTATGTTWTLPYLNAAVVNFGIPPTAAQKPAYDRLLKLGFDHAAYDILLQTP